MGVEHRAVAIIEAVRCAAVVVPAKPVTPELRPHHQSAASSPLPQHARQCVRLLRAAAVGQKRRRAGSIAGETQPPRAPLLLCALLRVSEAGRAGGVNATAVAVAAAHLSKAQSGAALPATRRAKTPLPRPRLPGCLQGQRRAVWPASPPTLLRRCMPPRVVVRGASGCARARARGRRRERANAAGNDHQPNAASVPACVVLNIAVWRDASANALADTRQRAFFF